MTSLTITIPLPPKELGQNSRGHWAKKASATKQYRACVAIMARHDLPLPPPMWKQANVLVKAFYPTATAPDPINILDRLKAAFDGLQDAGIIADDKGLWPLRPQISKDAKNPRIELVITSEP